MVLGLMADPIPFVPRVATIDPVAETVDRLRALLARAEAGHLRGIAYACAMDDGRLVHSWTFPEGSVNRSDAIAAATVLQAALVRDYLDNATEAPDGD